MVGCMQTFTNATTYSMRLDKASHSGGYGLEPSSNAAKKRAMINVTAICAAVLEYMNTTAPASKIYHPPSCSYPRALPSGVRVVLLWLLAKYQSCQKNRSAAP